MNAGTFSALGSPVPSISLTGSISDNLSINAGKLSALGSPVPSFDTFHRFNERQRVNECRQVVCPWFFWSVDKFDGSISDNTSMNEGKLSALGSSVSSFTLYFETGSRSMPMTCPG